MSDPALLRLLLKWHARYFVATTYHALLGREPDERGLSSYSATLSESGDLESLIRDIARSEEAWERTVFSKPTPLVSAAYRGLLGRDPEAAALTTYAEHLAGHRDLAATLAVIGQSEEHWRRSLAANAPSLVRQIFRALLKREPDQEALALYSQELRESADLAAVMSQVADSAEHWELLLHDRKHDSKVLLSDDLPALLAEVAGSPKIWNDLSALRFAQAGPADEAYDREAWVFIHAQKTGGTSLQNMLSEVFSHRVVYREHANTLHRRSPAELAQYSVFAGHFDFDSVAYIPRRIRHLATFLRDPGQRLLSQYRFLRAHERESPAFNNGMEIANRLDEPSFFRSVMAHASSGFWNHLARCVMGRRSWTTYRQLLLGSEHGERARHLEQFRADARSRLQEFAFVGIQEDYAHSCQRLFELIGARVPYVRHDHSVELLANDARFFKYVPPRPVTSELREALAPLVELDDIVYAEGRNLYNQRWGRFADANGYRSI